MSLPTLVRGAPPVSPSLEFVPDPASVQRYGPGYRYPQAGWIVVHIEGEPYERGYQHGRLLSTEIADYIKSQAGTRSPKAPGEAWHALRTTVNALFLRRFDKEYLEEMKGIADGAAAAGAKFDGRALDLVDIVAANSDMEVMCLDGALDATADGLEGQRFREPPRDRERAAPAVPEHCSAFAAVGPATADGKVVFGHITMFSLAMVRHYNVWLDVKPAQGHRVLMQTYPGGIQSGMDYYLNDAGLIVAETTIAQTRFDIDGRPLASRIRKALQYGDSIDDAVKILEESNNGLYTNEWLLADTRANEIAMFELGTHKSKLWRSSKGEWLAGTEGFYWGCNNTKDLQVRLETVASVEGKPANVVFHPSDRDRKWLALYAASKGKIDADFGFLAFTTPPLAAFPSCDAKFTTSDMARDLKTYALFGPPRGRTWDPTPGEHDRWADTRPLVSNDWTVLRATPPPSSENGKTPAVDLARVTDKAPAHDDDASDPDPVPGGQGTPNLAPAWHGTLLPKADADTWLAAAFADYERVVSLEKSLKARAKDGKLGRDARERIELALFGARSRYLTAVRRGQADLPLADIKADWTRDEWYQIASAKGVLLLAALRDSIGADPFEAMMDKFGRAHAGKAVSAAEFREAAETAHGKPLGSFFDSWLTGRGLPTATPGGTWSIASFEDEPEKALIVYGTRKEKAAQREAAERLQRAIARHWSNVTITLKADDEVNDDDLRKHHILLIGRPDSNAVAAQYAPALPVSFGPGSFAVNGKTYAHPASAVIAAGSNPRNARYSTVIFAGLGAEATWRSVEQSGGHGHGHAAEVLLLPAGSEPRPLIVPAKEVQAPVALEDARGS